MIRRVSLGVAGALIFTLAPFLGLVIAGWIGTATSVVVGAAIALAGVYLVTRAFGAVAPATILASLLALPWHVYMWAALADGGYYTYLTIVQLPTVILAAAVSLRETRTRISWIAALIAAPLVFNMAIYYVLH